MLTIALSFSILVRIHFKTMLHARIVLDTGLNEEKLESESLGYTIVQISHFHIIVVKYKRGLCFHTSCSMFISVPNTESVPRFGFII